MSNIKKDLCDDALLHYKKLVEENGEGFHHTIFQALVYYRQIPIEEEDFDLIRESIKELKEKGILYPKMAPGVNLDL